MGVAFSAVGGEVVVALVFGADLVVGVAEVDVVDAGGGGDADLGCQGGEAGGVGA